MAPLFGFAFPGREGFGLLVAAQTGDAPLDGARVAIFGAAIVWLIGNCFEIAASGRLTQVICAGVVVVAV